MIHHVPKHLLHVGKLALPIPVRVKDTIVNDPPALQLRVDIYTVHDPDPSDHTMSVSTVLTTDTFDLLGVVLIRHCIVKHYVP